MIRRFSLLGVIAILVLGLSAVGARSVSAASLCVAPSGAGGCQSTIQAAVDAAASGDTISVQDGTYAESVSITKSLTLQAAGSGAVVDATGLNHAIAISGTSGVTVSNFTIENAGDSGINVQSSSNVTISGNTITNNDKNLTQSASGPSCAGAEPPDQDDCGGALYLDNLTNSTISNNTVTKNADGLTLTDLFGPSHDNTISGNTFTGNTPECGIVLASHNSTPPNGVYDNTVENNVSSNNGASGVGIFSPFPGTQAYGNIVEGNTLEDNGHAGVTLHTHAPGTTDNNNQILNNTISGNNTLGDSSAGVTVTAGIILAAAVNPIMGTVISGNTISNESIGIFLGNTSGTVMTNNVNNATTPIVQVSASGLPGPGGPPSSSVVATPAVWPSGPGLAAGFVVTFTTSAAARGEVLFGTSCNGLTMTATQDYGAGGTTHWLLVSNDELSSTGTGVTPGATYYFAVVTITSSGVAVDNNKGTCYSASVPSTATGTAAPTPPTTT